MYLWNPPPPEHTEKEMNFRLGIDLRSCTGPVILMRENRTCLLSFLLGRGVQYQTGEKMRGYHRGKLHLGVIAAHSFFFFFFFFFFFSLFFFFCFRVENTKSINQWKNKTNEDKLRDNTPYFFSMYVPANWFLRNHTI